MADSATLLNLFRLHIPSADWTQHELAEFFRAQSILGKCGLSVVTDRGVSDEGDPWFVFCHEATGEVLVHIARIDRLYVVASQAAAETVRGKDLRGLIKALLETPAITTVEGLRSGPTLMVHPAALLTALVAASYLTHLKQDHDALEGDVEQKSLTSFNWLRPEFAILSAVAVATTWIQQNLDNSLLAFGTDDVVLQLEPERSTQLAQNTEGSTQFTSEHGRTADDLSLQKAFADDSAVENTWTLVDPPTSIASLKVAQLGAEPLPGVSPHTLPVPGNHDASSVEGLTTDLGSEELASNGERPTQNRADPEPVRVDRMVGKNDHPTSEDPVRPSSSNDTVRAAALDMTIETFPTNILTQTELLVPVANSEMLNAGFTLDTVEDATTILASNLELVDTLQPESAPPGAADTFDFMGQSILNAFRLATPRLEVLVSENDVVLIDGDASHASNPDFGVRTWEFEDGSTISIIGIIPHLDGMTV